MSGPWDVDHKDIFFVVISLCCEEDFLTIRSEFSENHLVVIIDYEDSFFSSAVEFTQLSHFSHVSYQFQIFYFFCVDVCCIPT